MSVEPPEPAHLDTNNLCPHNYVPGICLTCRYSKVSFRVLISDVRRYSKQTIISIEMSLVLVTQDHH